MSEYPLPIGTHVRVRIPEPGQPWHTCEGRAYKNECQPGDEGVIQANHENYQHGYVYSIVWDRRGSSRIDGHCLELTLTEEQLDAEARRLFGIEGA